MSVLDILSNNTNYFIDRPIQIINLIQAFNLAKVKYINEDVEFFVDMNFITSYPNLRESSISIKVLGGVTL
ncbi:MAG: hypothetical protein EOM05_02580 [Clostridia bacterium]|nr:hypothetical protein [Clostridia bacterium]